MPIAIGKRRDEYDYLLRKKQSVHFFDSRWIHLKKFAPLPSMTDYFSVIVVDGRLYLSTRKGFLSKNNFYRYEAEENKWIPLQRMIKEMSYHSTAHMLYLDGFIYSINEETKHMERYDILQNRWEQVQPIPHKAKKFSGVTFKGRIFASILVFDYHDDPAHQQGFHELLIYNPGEDMWQRSDILEGNNPIGFDILATQRFLFIHEEQCYRIDIQPIQGNDSETVTVNVVDVQVCGDGNINLTIKEEIKQDPKPAGRDTFRIHDKVFVYKRGCVYKDGPMNVMTPNQTTEIYSNIVMFTFDKRKVL